MKEDSNRILSAPWKLQLSYIEYLLFKKVYQLLSFTYFHTILLTLIRVFLFTFSIENLQIKLCVTYYITSSFNPNYSVII